MKKATTWRFWLEAGTATVTGFLFVITLIWRNWIEILFGIEPDHGDGSLEWFIVAALLVVTFSLFVLARYEWRRIRTAID
jgi:energy-coupling factor transporter transmembrane protein EcfT